MSLSSSIATAATAAFRLDTMATVLATGADAHSFLQGQLSADVAQLTPARILPASCNSPQGRVQAVVWLVQRSDALVLLLPAEMVEPTLARLRKYVLRAKVQLEPGADRLVPYLLDAEAAAALSKSIPESAAADPAGAPAAAAPPPFGARAHIECDGVSLIDWPSAEAPRMLLLAPAEYSRQTDAARCEAWRRADIRAGLPQVYAATHETFIAPMLNLDLLGGVSYEKGCYTGQEIIARMHFRGSVKRRMFRFRSPWPAPAPGTRVLAGDTHAGEVVDSATIDGGCEVLAVISLAQLDAPLRLESDPRATLTRLELPYTVPTGT